MVNNKDKTVKMDGLNKFHSLAEEKKKKILDAAQREFSESGFDRASTNRITAEAGISKGSLFYYFGSKENLYMYLIKICNSRLFRRLEPLLDHMPSDLIQRLKAIAESYLDLYIEEPRAFRFLMTLTDPGNKHLAERYMLEMNDENQKRLALLFTGIDMSRLSIGMEEMMKVITWTMTGMKEELLSRSAGDWTPDEFKKDFMKEYALLLKVLQKGIYNHQEDE